MRVWWLSPVKLMPGRQGRAGSGYVTEGGRRQQQEDSSYSVTTWSWPRWMSGVGGADTGTGEHLEEFEMSIWMNFIWPRHSFRCFCFSQTLSGNSWQQTGGTGGDMEEWGGQEKGICQGAPRVQETDPQYGGGTGGREVTSVTLDTAWPGTEGERKV